MTIKPKTQKKETRFVVTRGGGWRDRELDVKRYKLAVLR